MNQVAQSEKQSPLAAQQQRRVNFEAPLSNMRAVSEEADGKKVRRLRGYAILFDVFGQPRFGSVWREKVDKQALEGTDLSKLVLLWDHRTELVLGRAGKNMTVSVDETGLFFDCELGETWLDDYAFDRVTREIVDGTSFWFGAKSIIATDWENKIEVILKIDELHEGSIVTFPAYDTSVVIGTESNEDTTNLNQAPPSDSEDAGEDKRKQELVRLIQLS